MSNKFKAIVIDQKSEKFSREIKELDKDFFSKKSSFNKSWIITNSFEKYIEVINYNNTCQKEHSTYPVTIMNFNKNWRRLKLNWYIIYQKKVNFLFQEKKN